MIKRPPPVAQCPHCGLEHPKVVWVEKETEFLGYIFTHETICPLTGKPVYYARKIEP